VPVIVNEPAVDHREDLVPTYQYACTACDHNFDAVQSFTEDSLTVCPECSGRLRKVYAAVGVVFKGSGFYRNDSRAPVSANGSAGKESSDAGADKPAGKDTAGKDAGSKESGAKEPATRSKEPAKAGSNSLGANAKDSAGKRRTPAPSTGSGSAA